MYVKSQFDQGLWTIWGSSSLACTAQSHTTYLSGALANHAALDAAGKEGLTEGRAMDWRKETGAKLKRAPSF